MIRKTGLIASFVYTTVSFDGPFASYSTCAHQELRPRLPAFSRCKTHRRVTKRTRTHSLADLTVLAQDDFRQKHSSRSATIACRPGSRQYHYSSVTSTTRTCSMQMNCKHPVRTLNRFQIKMQSTRRIINLFLTIHREWRG